MSINGNPFLPGTPSYDYHNYRYPTPPPPGLPRLPKPSSGSSSTSQGRSSNHDSSWTTQDRPPSSGSQGRSPSSFRASSTSQHQPTSYERLLESSLPKPPAHTISYNLSETYTFTKLPTNFSANSPPPNKLSLNTPVAAPMPSLSFSLPTSPLSNPIPASPGFSHRPTMLDRPSPIDVSINSQFLPNKTNSLHSHTLHSPITFTPTQLDLPQTTSFKPKLDLTEYRLKQEDLSRRNPLLSSVSPVCHPLTVSEKFLSHLLEVNRRNAAQIQTIVISQPRETIFHQVVPFHHPNSFTSLKDVLAQQALAAIPERSRVVSLAVNTFHTIQNAFTHIGLADMDLSTTERIGILNHVQRLQDNHSSEMHSIFARKSIGSPEKCLINAERAFIDLLQNPRFHGAFQAIGGLAETARGLALSATYLGAIAGVPIAVHGLDHCITGVKTVILGQHQQTATTQLLHKAGLPPEITFGLDYGINAGISFSIGRTATTTEIATRQMFRLPREARIFLCDQWVLPKDGGGIFINGRWYTEHALERMAPNTPSVMAELWKRYMKRERIAALKLEPQKFLEWQASSLPNPRGIPPSVIEAEIACPRSTSVEVILNETGDVITVITKGSNR